MRFLGTLIIFLLRSLIVVVVQFYLEGISISPDKTNAPAPRDTNAVLSFAITLKPFEMVAGWHSQVIDSGRVVDPVQFALRPFQKRYRKRSFSHAVKDVRGTLIGKGPDHTISVLR